MSVTPIQKLSIYSQDIQIEFGFKKCTMLIIKSDKRRKKKGRERTDQKGKRTLESKSNYKFLGVFEAVTIK